MVTETVTVRYTTSGERRIIAALDDMGHSADRATRGIYLLQRAIFVLGGAGLASALVRQIDALTNYENRLRLTATSMQNMEEIQKSLFEVSNRSRTSFESSAEIYSRTALSVRELGISQEETLRFTESLAKATIISGASAREANAALIQLGQGLASNRLSGDELRSILEQLPFVADVISNSLGITRGELRKFGTEGKLSAEVVLKAFREAEGEIDALFAQTVPTISQSLTVAANNFKKFLDGFDDATGASAGIADAIISISESIGTLVKIAGLASAALLLLFTERFLQSIYAGIAAQAFMNQQAAAGNILYFNAIQIENLRAQSLLASAVAQQNLAATKVADLAATRSQMVGNLALINSQRAQMVTQVQLQQGIAAATGRTSGLIAAQALLNNSTRALIVTRRALAAVDLEATAATAALTGATTALTAAQARATAATTALGGAMARLAIAFPLAAAGARALAGALASVAAFAAANPFTFLLLAIGSLVILYQSLSTEAELVSASMEKISGTVDQLRIAHEAGKISAAAYATELRKISESQVLLDQAEAVDLLKDSLDTVTNSLQSFVNLQNNGLFNPVVYGEYKTILEEINTLYKAGSISALDAAKGVDSLAAASGNRVFQQFAAQLMENAKTADNAQVNIDRLDKILRILAGTLSVAESGLLNAAGAANVLAGAANNASGAIATLVNMIPQLAAAAKIQVDLGKAKAAFDEGRAELTAGANTRSIDETARRMVELRGLYNRAISEIDGTADATRSAAKAQEAYNNQAQLASRTGIDRALFSASNEYTKLVDQAKAAGASQAELNALSQNYASIQSSIQRDFADKGGSVGGAAGDGAVGAATKDLQDYIIELEKEAFLLGFIGKEREVVNKIISIESELKRDLTSTERSLIEARVLNNEALKVQSSLLESIIGPQMQNADQQAALNELMNQGAISAQQYTEKLRELRVEANQLSGTFGGGFKSTVEGAIMTVGDLGKAVGGELVAFVNDAADAIVKFAQTGEINIKQLFATLFANLLKLAAQQLLLKMLAPFLGGFSGGGSIGGGSTPKFATGGSILPSGAGTTDTQVVKFTKRPDERVDILTPAQQKAQAQALNGNGNQQAAPQTNVNVAAVLSPADIYSVFDSPEGETTIIKVLQRNGAAVRSIARGGS